MSATESYLFVQFDKETLAEHPEIKSQLLKFYCDMWRYDPNFGEYKKCPVCKKYFNHVQVEVNGINFCQGTPQNPHDFAILAEAWTEEIVWNDLEPLLNKGSDFFGAVAVLPRSGSIVGFVWGYAGEMSEITKRWNPNLVADLYLDFPSSKATYFQEIAVDHLNRKNGVGKVLCKMLVAWMKRNYPNYPSFLNTHINSPAYPMFQKAGYQLYQEMPVPNKGRIFLATPIASLLTPENLISR